MSDLVHLGIRYPKGMSLETVKEHVIDIFMRFHMIIPEDEEWEIIHEEPADPNVVGDMPNIAVLVPFNDGTYEKKFPSHYLGITDECPGGHIYISFEVP